jgi:two-component system, LytTR family, response regulator
VTRVLVVDDEPLARRRVREILSRDPDLELAESADGRDAARRLREESFDLLVLDIQMPGLDGFGVLERVPTERLPVVVFVTAYDEHAVRAFEVRAIDYVLKPFSEKRLREAVERAKQLLAADPAGLRAMLRALAEEVSRRRRTIERLPVTREGRIVFVSVGDIDWIEAEGNYVRIHSGPDADLVRGTIAAFESRLDPERFRRIHRSYVVNVDRIAEVEPLFHGEHVAVLKGGKRLPVGRRYRERLLEKRR